MKDRETIITPFYIKEWLWIRKIFSDTIWIHSSSSSCNGLSFGVLTLHVHPLSAAPEALISCHFWIPLYFWFHNRKVVLFVGIEFWFLCFPRFSAQSSIQSLFDNWIKVFWDRTWISFTLGSIKLHINIISSDPKIFTFFIFEAIVGSKLTCYTIVHEVSLVPTVVTQEIVKQPTHPLPCATNPGTEVPPRPYLVLTQIYLMELTKNHSMELGSISRLQNQMCCLVSSNFRWILVLKAPKSCWMVSIILFDNKLQKQWKNNYLGLRKSSISLPVREHYLISEF